MNVNAYIMSYLSSIHFDCPKTVPFPFDVPAVKFGKHLNVKSPIVIFVGDNGTGKSTLIETFAYRMQLPHMDGSTYAKSCFDAARTLLPYLEIEYKIMKTVGFFFRAEDFGEYINSVDRRDASLHKSLEDLEGSVPNHIIKEMKDNANSQLYHMRKNYGQELQSYSHGEAFLQIMQEKIKSKGIFILDEPEAALSPLKQLSLIYFIREHLTSNLSQFIIATHSPILMSIPNAKIFEITHETLKETPLEDTEHFSITKSFLNHPELYLNSL